MTDTKCYYKYKGENNINTIAQKYLNTILGEINHSKDNTYFCQTKIKIISFRDC